MNDIDEALLERIREKTLLIRSGEERLADLTYEARTLRRTLGELRADRERLLAEQAAPTPMPLFDQVETQEAHHVVPDEGSGGEGARGIDEREAAPVHREDVRPARQAKARRPRRRRDPGDGEVAGATDGGVAAQRDGQDASADLPGVCDSADPGEHEPAPLTDGPFHLECTRCYEKRPPFAELRVHACPACQNPEFAIRPGEYSGPRWWEADFRAGGVWAVYPATASGKRTQQAPTYFVRADSLGQATEKVRSQHPADQPGLVYRFVLELWPQPLGKGDYVIDARVPEDIPQNIPSASVDIPAEPAPIPDPVESILGLCDLHPPDPLTPVLTLALNELPRVTVARMRSEGATDGVIKGQLLAGHWGDGPGHDVPRKAVMGGYWTRGGTRPALWTTDPDDHRDAKGGHKRPAAKNRRPDLEGQELMARVRALLKIPKPGQVWKSPEALASPPPPLPHTEPKAPTAPIRSEIEAGITPGWRGKSLLELPHIKERFDPEDPREEEEAFRWAERVREALGLALDQEPTVGHVIEWTRSGERDLAGLVAPGADGTLLNLCDGLLSLAEADSEFHRDVPPQWYGRGGELDEDVLEDEAEDDTPGGGYEPSHPWYYKLGGLPVPPEEIGPGANIEPDLVRDTKVERWGIRKRLEYYIRYQEEAERLLGEAIEAYREFIADAENLADLAAAVDRERRKPSSDPIHQSFCSQYNTVLYRKRRIEAYHLLLEQLRAEAGEDVMAEASAPAATPEQREAMLRDALQCDTREHRVDWTLIVAQGATDADLRKRIVAAFGPTHELRSGHTQVTDATAMSWTVRGGRHPAIWFGWHIDMDGQADMPAPDLRDWPLVHEVRRMLAIPTPEAVAGRQALVAELDADGERAERRLTSRPAKKSDTEAHAELVKRRRAKRQTATQEARA